MFNRQVLRPDLLQVLRMQNMHVYKGPECGVPYGKTGKRRRERGLQEWRERVGDGHTCGQVPGQGRGTGPLRAEAGGQGERQEEQGEGRWSQSGREGQCQTQDQRIPGQRRGR